MKKRNALQTLDVNDRLLSKGPQRQLNFENGAGSATPRSQSRHRRRRSSISSNKETFTSKKTPKISNCATTTTTIDAGDETEQPLPYSRPPIPPPVVQQGGGRKKQHKKSFITTRRRKEKATTTPESPAGRSALFETHPPERPEGVITTRPYAFNNIDKAKKKMQQTTATGNNEITRERIDISLLATHSQRNYTIPSSSADSASSSIRVRLHRDDIKHQFKSKTSNDDDSKRKNDPAKDMMDLSSDDDMDCGSDTSSIAADLDSSSEEKEADPAGAIQNDKANSSSNHVQTTGTNDNIPPDHQSIDQKNLSAKSAPDVSAKYNAFTEQATPNRNSNEFSNEQIEAMKKQPADDENVFRLVMDSESAVSTQKEELVGKVIGGDRLYGSEPDMDDASDITGSTTVELKKRKLIASLNSFFDALDPKGLQRGGGQLLSHTGTKSAIVVPARQQENKWCRAIGDFPLEVGRTVEEWSMEEGDDSASESSILFRRGGKRYIHRPLPPGWRMNVPGSDEGKRLLYTRLNEKETPTCPVDLPSKSDAKSMRIAKVGDRKGDHVKICFEPSTYSHHHLSTLPPRNPVLKQNEAPKQWWSSELETKTLSTARLGEQMGERVKVAVASSPESRNRRDHNSNMPLGCQTEDNSPALESSMSSLLRSCGPRDVHFQKTPLEPHKYTPAISSKIKTNKPGTGDMDCETTDHRSSNRMVAVHKARRTRKPTESETDMLRSRPDEPKACDPSQPSTSKKLSPVAEVLREAIHDQESQKKKQSLAANEPAIESSSKIDHQAATNVSKPSMKSPGVTPENALLREQTPGATTGGSKALQSAFRRFQGLALTTLVISTDADEDAILPHSKNGSTQKLLGESGSFTPSATQTPSHAFRNSLARSTKREFTSSLKRYNLGPAKRSPQIMSGDGNEKKSISSQDDSHDEFDEQTPPSPLQQQTLLGHGSSQRNPASNLGAVASKESLEAVSRGISNADQTPLSPLRQQPKGGVMEQAKELQQIDLPSTMKAPTSSFKSLSLRSDSKVPESTKFGRSAFQAAVNRASAAKTPLVYETVGISTQCQVKTSSLSSSQRVFLARSKAAGTKSSRRKQKNVSKQVNGFCVQKYRAGDLVDFDDISESEVSPLAITRKSDEQRSSSSHDKKTEKKTVVPHKNIDESATLNGLEDGQRNDDIPEQEYQIEPASAKGAATLVDETPKPDLVSTTASRQSKNGIASASSSEKHGDEAKFKERDTETQGTAMRSETHHSPHADRNYSEPPSPDEDSFLITANPKTPKKRSSEEMSQLYRGDDMGQVPEDHDAARNLPIEGEWESPGCSGIASYGGGSDEESPLLDIPKTAKKKKITPKAGMREVPESELESSLRGRLSKQVTPSRRRHDLLSGGSISDQMVSKAGSPLGDRDSLVADQDSQRHELEDLGYQENDYGALESMEYASTSTRTTEVQGKDMKSPRRQVAEEEIRAVDQRSLSDDQDNAGSICVGGNAEGSLSEPTQEDVEFPMDDRESSVTDQYDQEQDVEESEDEDDTIGGGGFDGQESSLQDDRSESIDSSKTQETEVNTRKRMDSVRRRIARDLRPLDQSDLTDEQDSIGGSVQIRKGRGSKTISAPSVPNSPTSSESSRVGFGWRVLHPPHPICILQRLDSLPRRRKKRQVQKKSKAVKKKKPKAVHTATRKKRKAKQRK